MMQKLKIFLRLMVCVFMLLPFMSANALEKFTFEDWDIQSGAYGSVTKIDDNVTNIKGVWYEDKGMAYGPFTKKSQTSLEDGITEEINIELNKETIANGEFFELSMAFNDSSGNYSDEVIVMTQRVDDVYVLTSGKAPEFNAQISEDGIYTYRYSAYLKDGTTYWQFTLLKDGTTVATTGEISLGVTDFKQVRYIWFCNIRIDQGVNVYTNVPTVSDSEDSVTSEESETTSEEITDEETNPKTSDGILITIGILGVSAFALIIARKKLV